MSNHMSFHIEVGQGGRGGGKGRGRRRGMSNHMSFHIEVGQLSNTNRALVEISLFHRNLSFFFFLNQKTKSFQNSGSTQFLP